MGRDQISPRQLYLIYIVALLSPIAAVLPKWTVATAGRGAWLTGLVALVPMVGVLWLWGRLVRPGQGFAQMFQQVLGPLPGKLLTILYVGWVVVLLSVEARAYGERMLSAGYENGSLGLFLAVMLGLCLWMGRKKLAAFARMAEILYLLLGVTLVVVLAFALVDMEPRQILPVTLADGPGILAATLVPLSLLSTGVLGGFVWDKVKVSPGAGRQGFAWLVGIALVMTLMQVGVLAHLGPNLAGEIPQPFIQVARGIGVAGAFQRVESLVIAIWLMSDFALLCLLLFAGEGMLRGIWGEKGEGWSPWVLIGLGFLGALFGVEQGEWVPTFLLGSGFVLGIGVPTLVWMALIWGEKFGSPKI